MAKETKDKLGVGKAFFSFLIPPVGAIIYFRNKEDKPKKAEAAGKLALVGLGLGLVRYTMYQGLKKK